MLRLSLLFLSVHRKSGRWWHLFSRVSRPRWVACPFFFFFFAVAFYRYMKHLQIQQNQTYRSSWIRSCSSDDFLIFSFFLLLHIMIHWNKRHSCWILCIHWPVRTTTVPPGTNDLIDSARNPWRTFHLAAHRVLIDWCLFCQSEVASICH